MAEQSINLGPLDFANNHQWNGAVLVDAALVDGGAEAYLRVVRGGANPRIRLSATPSEIPSTAGPGFTAAVETYAEALTFSEAGGESIVLKGPNHPDNTFGDATEPYFWTPDNTVAWQSWYQGLGAGDVTLTIRDGPAANQDPTVVIDTQAQTVDGGAAVQLATTASDQDGSIASYAWAADPDVGMFDEAAAEDPTWTAPEAGAAEQAVTLTVTVTDDQGGMGQASVVLTVRAANQDPTVAIDTQAQTVDGATAVRLAATASDLYWSIASYAWVADPDVGAFDDAAADDPTWTAPAAGSDEQAVTLTVTVVDDRGGTASASVVVTVRADEIPAGAWVRTVEGDVLDALCWRHYGRGDAVPAVLDANPGLAALGPELPAGLILALPDLPAPERRAAAVRLWEETPR